tara:strand:+ start:4576 stop:5427 length:852 start_codon:yes stop_codon:yes gene_type:complete
MNAERLIELYDRIADSPDAVNRLRRFVLDLAVRGRLSEPNSSDGSSFELLSRLKSARTELIASKQIRARQGKEPRLHAVPFEVPSYWQWTALGTVFQYDAGIKVNPARLAPKEWLLELEDIEKNSGRLLAKLTVEQRGAKSTKSKFEAYDILYGKLRPYLNKAIVASEGGYSTTEIVAIRPWSPICSAFSAIALRSPQFVDYVTRLGQGTKMPRLRGQDAINAPFPLPPLAEQHRIVAKVDELMALCDRLEASLQQADDKRARLLDALLAEALESATNEYSAA